MSSRIVPPFIKSTLRWIQFKLDFNGCYDYAQFATKHGLGRVAWIASILGAILSVHLMFLLQLALAKTGFLSFMHLDETLLGTQEVFHMILQWLIYVVALSFFHLAEFYITAVYNPSEASADSFMINHSIAYTAAALMAWVEFWIRLAFVPSMNSVIISFIGLIIVVVGQVCRTLAMTTCGENFNHVIQSKKKNNHVLVTHGIYRYLRHPSYVGFYYWSVGTQLLLCNPISSVLFSLVAWLFFRKRIPYEEKTLMQHFPEEYPDYVSRSYIGIPFIHSDIKKD